MAKSTRTRNAALALGAVALAYGITKVRQRIEPTSSVLPPPLDEPPPQSEPVSAQEPSPRGPAPGWRFRLGIVAMVVGVLLLIVAGVVAWSPHHAHSSGTISADPNVAIPLEMKDKAGQTITLDTDVAPATLKKMHAVSQIGTSFVKIPAINFNTPLGAVDMVDGQLTPPGIYSVYWVRNLGVSVDDATQGTVYLVIHSVHGGALVPGNQLINVDQGTSAVPLGATITVDSRSYRVVRTDVISRTELPTREDVWNDAPRQLVLITCLEQPDGAEAVSNVVVWAQLLD